MQSKNINYIPALDHLRFYAAMMIVVFHLANGDFVHQIHLDVGIPLFFTLSGYLFFTIAYKKNKEILYWRFLYNRFLRIYPLIVFLFMMTVVIMNQFTALDFINLIGLNLPGVERKSWIVGDWGYQHLSFNWWTIGVEFTFYMIFPFLFKFYRAYGIKYLILLWLLVIILKFSLYEVFLQEHGWKKLSISFNYSFFTNFDIFIVGMIAGHFKETKSKEFSFSIHLSRFLFVLYVSFMWYVLMNHIDSLPVPISTSVCALLCSGLIVFYQTMMEKTKENGLTNALSSLGAISFSIYLLHDFMKNAIKAFGLESYFMTLVPKDIVSEAVLLMIPLILHIPIILAISFLSFYLIERPFLDMRVKY